MRVGYGVSRGSRTYLHLIFNGWVPYVLRSKNISVEKQTFELDKGVSDALLVSTETGLFLLSGRTLTKLFGGGRFFGIARHRDRWLACFVGSGHAFGRIISFRLDGDNAVDCREEFRVASQYFHQAVVHEDTFYVVDSSWKTTGDRVFVFDVSKGKAQLEYKHNINNAKDNIHANYIIVNKDKFFILFHNNSYDTGKNSNLLQFDRDWQLISEEELDGQCCHDVFFTEDGLGFSDSINHRFVVGKKSRVLKKSFPRGLATKGQVFYLGLSIFAAREYRKNSDAEIAILDCQTLEVLDEISLPEVGAISELALVAVG